MPGLGLLAQILGTGGTFAGNWLNLIQNMRAADRMNKLADEGRAELQGLAGPTKDMMTREALALRDSTRTAQKAGYDRSKAVIAGLASNYFGVPPVDVPQAGSPASKVGGVSPKQMKGLGAALGGMGGAMGRAAGREPNPSDEAQAQANNYGLLEQLSKIQLGQGGEAGAVRGAGEQYVQSIVDRENARTGELRSRLDAEEQRLQAERDRTVEALGGEYKSVLDRATAAVTDIRNRTDDTIKLAKQGFEDTLSWVKDNSRYAIASTASTIMKGANDAVSALSATLTGDPVKDAMVTRQIAAVKQKYADQAKQTVSAESDKMSNFAAEVRLKATEVRENAINAANANLRAAHSEQGSVVAAAFDAWGRNVNEANQNLRLGKGTVLDIWNQAMTSASQFVSQARGLVFGALTDAVSRDAQVLQGLFEATRGLSDQAVADQIARDTTLSDMIITAELNGVKLQTAAAQSKIDAKLATVDFALPFRDLYQAGYDQRQMRLKEEEIEYLKNRDSFGGQFAMGAGNALGAGLGGMMFCWVANEIYGSWDDERTILFRWYISTYAPGWLRELYGTYGEWFASVLRRPNWKWLRPIVKFGLDLGVARMRKVVP